MDGDRPAHGPARCDRTQVSPIAFGTWQLGGEWGQFDEDEGIAAIRQARELGAVRIRR
jgi:aryl-alcohol dehydrogenase-like predicted oxidoreductase